MMHCQCKEQSAVGNILFGDDFVAINFTLMTRIAVGCTTAGPETSLNFLIRPENKDVFDGSTRKKGK